MLQSNRSTQRTVDKRFLRPARTKNFQKKSSEGADVSKYITLSRLLVTLATRNKFWKPYRKLLTYHRIRRASLSAYSEF